MTEKKKQLTVDDLPAFGDEVEGTLAGGWWQPGMSTERREQPSAAPIARVSLLPGSGEGLLCRTGDVSASGVLLQAEDGTVLSIGEFVEVTLVAAGLELEMSAIVVRHAADGGFGVRFIDVEPAQREQLDVIVAGAKRAAADADRPA